MHVPGVVGAGLTDKQIADVMNYVMTTWGESSLPAEYKPFTEAEVTTLRAEPVGDVVAYRRKVAEDLLAQGIATAGVSLAVRPPPDLLPPTHPPAVIPANAGTHCSEVSVARPLRSITARSESSSGGGA